MSWDLPAMLTILSIGVLNDDNAKINKPWNFSITEKVWAVSNGR